MSFSLSLKSISVILVCASMGVVEFANVQAATNTRVASARVSSGGLAEALLVEATLTQGTQTISGRVLIEAGRTEWTKVAEAPHERRSVGTPLKLEARANLIDSDVVEIETRTTGSEEQNGKMIVRLGERAEMTNSQMEGAETKTAGKAAASSVDVKVLRVRYAL